MAFILYPAELFNEKFLIKVRDCTLKLSEQHPVKKWLKTQSSPQKPSADEQSRIDFLNEILNSQFNLITDQKVKGKVIALLGQMPSRTNVEKLLKSYLYLMIGNITRSDNLLKTIISQSPREFYQGYSPDTTFYHKMTLENLDKVLAKFARHPADRLTFFLFTKYVQAYLNRPELLSLMDDIQPEGMGEKLGLAYTEKSAPELVGFARLERMSEKRRMRNLRSHRFSSEMQAYWVWPYLDIDPLISEVTVDKIKALDESDPLWAIYLLENEKLVDSYLKKGGHAVSRRRPFLRKNLESRPDFMMTLFKLIEIGDIDESLVKEVSNFMTHE